jgi:hypothetical protein
MRTRANAAGRRIGHPRLSAAARRSTVFMLQLSSRPTTVHTSRSEIGDRPTAIGASDEGHYSSSASGVAALTPRLTGSCTACSPTTERLPEGSGPSHP